MKLQLCVIALLLGCGTAYAQVNVEMTADGSLGIIVSARVKGVPFSADVICNEDFQPPNGREFHMEIHGKMYRDSQGRTRTDRQEIVDGKTRIQPSTITDPVQQIVMTIEHNQRIIKVLHGQAGKVEIPPPPVESHQVASQFPTFEPLGTMVVEGYLVRGTRYTRSLQPLDRTESWTADALGGMTLLMKSEGPQPGTVMTVRLTNISREEPDPAVFQAPPDYAVRDAGMYPGFPKAK